MDNFERIDLVGDPVRNSLNAEKTTFSYKVQYFFQKASIQAILYPVVGVDISSWQGVMDWGKAKDKIHFAFLRAGVGNSTLDPTFVTNRSECMSRDIVWSMYWYLKPDKNPLTTAENFAAVAKDAQYNKMPIWADLETNGGLDKSALSNWVSKFHKRFKELTDKDLGYYTSPGFANANLWQTEVQDILKWQELWVANWTTNNEPDVPWCWSKVNTPKPWTYWQFTSKGIGNDYGAKSLNIDLNRYHYTIGNFNSAYDTHIAPLPFPEPPPTPIPTLPEKVVVNVSNLNIRNSMSLTSDAILGQTSLGKIWYPDGMEKDSNGKYWYYFGSKKKIYIASWLTKVA